MVPNLQLSLRPILPSLRRHRDLLVLESLHSNQYFGLLLYRLLVVGPSYNSSILGLRLIVGQVKELICGRPC